MPALRCCQRRKPGSQPHIRRNTTGDHQIPGCSLIQSPHGLVQRTARAVDNALGHSHLEGSAEVGDILVRERDQRSRLMPDSRLQSRERKVWLLAAKHGPRQREPAGITLRSRALDSRTAGLTQAEKLRRLVEGFAQRVVDGRPQTLVTANIPDELQLRMPAGNEQKHIGRPEAVGQADGQRMRFEMINSQQRKSVRQGNGFCRGQTNDQAADQAWPRRCRNTIQIRPGNSGLAQGLLDYGIQALDVGACGNLRHDPTVGPVLLPLGAHDIR